MSHHETSGFSTFPGYTKEILAFCVMVLIIGLLGAVFTNTQIQAAFTATALVGAALLLIDIFGVLKHHGFFD